MTTTTHDATPTPLYYAEDGIVWKRPVRTRNNNGGYSVSLGFPVCEMHEAAGKKNAETLAEMLCAAEGSAALAEENARLVTILQEIRSWCAEEENSGPLADPMETLREIRSFIHAALAQKEPENV